MRTARILILMSFCLAAGSLCAQSFNSGKNRKTFKGISEAYPHHGLGFKLGDPVALTYKFYLTRDFAFVADFGKVASTLYNRYFREEFSRYIRPDTFMTSDASIDYASHAVRSDLVGEVRFLYNMQLTELLPGLHFYLGGGWQWKQTSLDYTYLYNSATVDNIGGQFSRRRLTMGPQMTAGLEYSDFDIPVAAFLEIDYYKDIQIDPGYQRFEGGVGLRFIF